MQYIKRKIISLKKPEIFSLQDIGFNTNEVLTFKCKNMKGEEVLINLNGQDLHMLRKFIQRIQFYGN